MGRTDNETELQQVIPQLGSVVEYLIAGSEFAEENSQCKRKGVTCQVFAVVQNSEGPIIRWRSSHYNGPIKDDQSLCSNEVGNCGCVHAEERAALWLMQRRMITDALVAVNYSPCTRCANLLIETGKVRFVVYRTLTEHDPRGWNHLIAAGIAPLQIKTQGENDAKEKEG